MSNTNVELQRVHALIGERSLTLVLPKTYATELGIGMGQFLKCHVENNKLILEKAEF
jgi:antitoxin component of MazEF toxin-antitoxin module